MFAPLCGLLNVVFVLNNYYDKNTENSVLLHSVYQVMFILIFMEKKM